MIDSGILVRRAIEAAVFPPTGPLLLLLLAIVLMRRRPRAGRALAAVAGVTIWLASTQGFGELLLAPLEDAHPALTAAALSDALASQDPPRAIVVLGGGIQHDARELPWPDKPRAHTLARLVHGAALSRNSGLPVLVSGGTTRSELPPEAEVMARLATASLGIEPRWVETQSLDTLGNARESAKLLGGSGVHSIVLVTTAAHMPRAVALFEATGLRVLPAPADFSGRGVRASGASAWSWMDWIPSPAGVEDVWYGLHEWAGISWYRLRSSIVRARAPTMARSETPYSH